MGMPPAVEKKVHRQAAAAVGKLLKADEKKRGGANIKTLTLAPANIAKKATYALTCETLRYLPVLKQILELTTQLRFSQHLRPELAYVLVYDLLFGQGLSKCAPPEQVVLACKSALRASLARLLVKNGVSSADELLPADSKRADAKQPRYARVNTLKTTLEEALRLLQSLEGTEAVKQDPVIPNLLVFPPGTDLHDHALVKDGRLILQGKASCMPAQALNPKPSWTVIDACAAPGNKTIHLAALMGNKGKVIACDADGQRIKTLRKTIEKAGAKNIDARHQDFLKLDPNTPEHSRVKAILLDPSCSGSGTRLQRMDHLLPSNTDQAARSSTDTTCSPYEPSTPEERERVDKLASFQETALRHALQFPGVRKLVYSTCSVYRRENEDVVAAVLPGAREKGFELVSALAEWPHRGLPAFEGAHYLLRTDASRDHMDGFFVALFEKTRDGLSREDAEGKRSRNDPEATGKRKRQEGKALANPKKIKDAGAFEMESRLEVDSASQEGPPHHSQSGHPSTVAEKPQAPSEKARGSLLRRRKAKRERKKGRMKVCP